MGPWYMDDIHFICKFTSVLLKTIFFYILIRKLRDNKQLGTIINILLYRLYPTVTFRHIDFGKLFS